MAITTPGTGPQAWKAEDVRTDNTWILRLTPEEVAGFRVAMEHARKANKPLLDMEKADFPLPAASCCALERAVATTQGRWGMCLVKGFPTDEWTEPDLRVAYWGMGLHMGVARPQNRASEVINDVRDAGGSYKTPGGRGYNTSAALDFHQDSCDVVALLCRRTAKAGGTSKVMSSLALRDRVRDLRPDLLPVLADGAAWFHSFQGTQEPNSQPPFTDGRSELFCARTNRKNTAAAQRDFAEVPRLTREQEEALDLLDDIMPSEEYCYSMELERGDMQLLNSFVTLHSRTGFEDHDDGGPDAKRHLLRLWLSIPTSQALPPAWAEYWGDVRAGAVRGGVRGSGITEEFKTYERRQAGVMGMPFKPWEPVVTKDDMARILAGQAVAGH
ncbi:Clavaminate synthase-like protein [Apiospora kogelbergensis]|uniref:Clavaminate synthase-like protein n=1 Tax=Apiospora kogelbergensis TaxID=1337665 RepID=A0AAW0QXN3_9PEZI